MKTESFTKQIPKNLLINILSFLATVVIGLWMTPYLLGHLGIVAYGLIPLAMFLSQYVSVIINAINMSIGRFLLISLQQNEDAKSNEIFNTSLAIILAFIVIQALVMWVILLDISGFFTIPKLLLIDAIWLFALTFIGFSISLLRSIFGTSMYAYNRLDILRMIDIVQNIVRVLSIVILFSYDTPSLKYMGIANLLASLSAIVPTLYYFKRFTPQLKIHYTAFSVARVKELSPLSMWILINQVGVLLLGNIDLYLVNRWIGSQATGEYAIILQFVSIFKTFILLLSGILTPVVMIYYAKGKHEELKVFIIISSKVMILGLIYPLSVLICFSEEILSLWLGKSYLYLASIISFSLVFFVSIIPVIVLFNITIAYNKVKTPAILALCFGFLNISFIYLVSLYMQEALWGLISVKLLFEILFSIFIIFYVSKILDMSYAILYRVYFLSILLFTISYMMLSIIKEMIEINSLTILFMIILVLIPLIVFIYFKILFTSEEKSILLRKYPRFEKYWNKYHVS